MLSNSCRYGIRAVVYIASLKKANGNIGIKKISEALELPTPYLAKILQQLAKNKILLSAKGPNGGFSMLRDPKKISLLNIVEIIDGNDFFNNCIFHNSTCSYIDSQKIPCPIHDEFGKVRAELINMFSNTSIYDLATKAVDTGAVII
jgi:Rrf2 family transcriptional regulator, iron-sulfur cluster assembly transcription factor